MYPFSSCRIAVLCKHMLIMVCFISVLTPSRVSQADEALDTWLQRMECYELLAAHLERRLDAGSLADKSKAAQALADLYASMLSTADEQNRSRILLNVRKLLERKPSLATTDLRLQLLRGSYLAAEQVLEQYRFRVVEPAAHAEALDQMREINVNLQKLRPKLMEIARGLCTTLLAWSTYYIARHDRDEPAAKNAAKLFAEVLQASNASLQEVSTDLRIHEYGARALLGIALCKEVANDPAGSEPWLEELEVEGVWAEVKRQVPLWRLHIQIDDKHWLRVIELLEEETKLGGIPDYWLLLIASRALEDLGNKDAATAASMAIGQLVVLEQLSMVSALADKHGARVLQGTDFVRKYILADLQFQQLRNHWDSTDPSENEQVRKEFAKVASLLEEATLAADAASFNHALSACRFLLGHALFQAGSYASASLAFSNSSQGDRIEESMWMTIICLDRLKPRSFEQEELRDITIERYLALFPSSHRSSKLKVHRSFDENPHSDTIDDLLAIQTNDPMFANSRRRAEDLIYTSWRNAMTDRKDDAGNAYLEIALPILYQEARAVNPDKSEVISRCRRVLEVSLHHAVERSVAAEKAFAILAGLDIQDSEILDELTFRNIQLQIIDASIVEAVAMGISLLKRSPDSSWNNHAAVALLNAIRILSDDEKTSLMESHYRIGIAYTNSLADDAFKKDGQFSVATKAIENGYLLWKEHADTASGQAALEVSRRILLTHENNRVLLRLSALLEEGVGNKETALQHWRTLSKGTEKGSSSWFESRYKVISLLLNTKPSEAHKLLLQHHVLYPAYATPPLDSKFKELEEKLALLVPQEDRRR